MLSLENRMKILSQQQQLFIYTYGCRPEETELFHLEARSFFGDDYNSNVPYMISPIEIDPDRSPFMRERLEILYEGEKLSDIIAQVEQLELNNQTFKITYIKTNDLKDSSKIDYDERRNIERQLGMAIDGEADMRVPDIEYGIITLGGRWYFGIYIKSKAIWLQHMHKPKSYSIALSTRVARAITNIAVPDIEELTAIDPCCGIGTVLVEALSMNVDIVGRDINHFVVRGTRENLKHFNMETDVVCGDIAEVTEHYDVAILDLPYNHFSHATEENQFYLLKHARRIANKLVIVSVADIDHMLNELGFTIVDRCTTRKGNFIRQIIVCR